MGYIEEESYKESKHRFSKDMDSENAYARKSKVDPFSSSMYSHGVNRSYNHPSKQGGHK